MFVAVPFFLRRGVTCVTRSITSSSSSLLRPSAARNARRSRRSLEFGRTHLPFVCRPFSTSTSHHEPAPENIYNIPNTLSLLRIVSSPFMSWLIVTQRYTAAALAFGAIAVTDVADGYIARNYNQKTVVGSFLDPMADKIQSIAVTGALGYQYLLSPWIVALLVGKDVCLMLGTVLVRIVAVVRLRREATQTAKRTDITAAQLDEAQQSLATLRSPVGFVGALFNVAPSALGKGAAVSVVVLLSSALAGAAWPSLPGVLGCVAASTRGTPLCVVGLEYVTGVLTIGAALQYLINWVTCCA